MVGSVGIANAIRNDRQLRRYFPSVLEAFKKILIPVNEAEHWWLLVADISNKSLIVYDSLRARKNHTTHLAIRQCLGSGWVIKLAQPVSHFTRGIHVS